MRSSTRSRSSSRTRARVTAGGVRRGAAVVAVAAGLLAAGAGTSQAAGTGAAHQAAGQRALTNHIEAAGDGKKEAAEDVPGAATGAPLPSVGTVRGLAHEAPVTLARALPEDGVIPEGTEIGVPEVVPGVPSVGVVPLAVPELPVTPTVPVP
ncbi:hypothetical protein [Streptomyces sp. HNM0574]|uniref:hypothetical protein n=1 Tax=Streptomyces sp. HNM0574 TaxID=2714954 RepID=UPI00146B3095|nr:hypothetical protein [Streptomyces sp. HNM0574]NLU66839.1 hypothetical protein [Streptomyces sp. HNM0574]